MIRYIALCTAAMTLPALAYGAAAPVRVTKLSVPAAAIAVRQDGGYYTAGGVTDTASHTRIVVTAYLPNGTLDRSFGSGGETITDPSPLTNSVSRIAIAPDGKIVVGGNADFDNASARGGNLLVERLTSAGQPDITFGQGGIVTTDLCSSCDLNDRVTGLVVQPDGRIAVSAYSIRHADTRFTVVRYTVDGQLDTGFGDNGVIDTTQNGAYSIALQPDGKILAGGNDGGSIELFRYLSNGQADPAFGTAGKVVAPFENPPMGDLQGNAISINLLSDGRFVVGTPFIRTTESYQFAAVRFLADGSLDRSFGNKSLALAPQGLPNTCPTTTLLLPNGKLIIAGIYNYTSPVDPRAKSTLFAARLDKNGAFDTSFGNNGVLVIDPQPKVKETQDDIGAIALSTKGAVLGVADAFDTKTGSETSFKVSF